MNPYLQPFGLGTNNIHGPPRLVGTTPGTTLRNAVNALYPELYYFLPNRALGANLQNLPRGSTVHGTQAYTWHPPQPPVQSVTPPVANTSSAPVSTSSANLTPVDWNVAPSSSLPNPAQQPPPPEMDHAASGDSALKEGDFASAIDHYTQAIAINPTAVVYYIQRSTAYTRISPPDHEASFKDADLALSLASKRAKRELIGQSQLRRAIALFGLQRFADAKQCLEWVKKFNEKEKTLGIWEMKVASKLKGLEEGDQRVVVSVKEIPDVDTPFTAVTTQSAKPMEKQETSQASASPKGVSTNNGPKEVTRDGPTTAASAVAASVQTPASKIRHEWYQTNESVIVTLFCKGIPKDQATVEIKQNSLEVAFPLPTGSDFQFSLDPLCSNIDRIRSYYKIMSTKAEFTLMKATPGQKWASIEGTSAASTDNTEMPSNDTSNETAKRAAVANKTTKAAPAYPTSSKSGPKDWDKVAADLSKRSKEDAKEGGEGEIEESGIDEEDGDPATNFFKMLYKGADEDTKRAMMKSYQESNGTALSTNWNEVSKGPVETSPPDGMEAKQWG